MREQKSKEKAKANLMKALETCEDDILRLELLGKIKQITVELEGLETEIAKEKTKTFGINKEEIKFFLKQFKNYDMLNVNHRKAIINMLINKIYLYDDKIVFTFQSGIGKVEITDKMYTDIKQNTVEDNICLQVNSAHHKNR